LKIGDEIPAETASFRSTTVSAVREDWMVVCAVSYEPVSACNSLLTGKLTGNFAISGLLEAISVRKTPFLPQRFPDNFPAKINREIILGDREISGPNREICIALGKRPFLARLFRRGPDAICSHR
jgi:hypothetical protein